MSTELVVTEPDVLIGAAVFLIERGAVPYQFSVAAGKGIDTSGATARLSQAYAAIGSSPRFSPWRGADQLPAPIEFKGWP